MAPPLSKRDKQGALYVRPAAVEAKLDALQGHNDWAGLGKRARITDRTDVDYLPSECLVHMIRGAIRRSDQRLATALMGPLLIRCEAMLLRMVPDHGLRNAEAVREEILSSFQLLFTDDAAGDALDFYECRFGRAFRALRITHVRAAIAERKELIDLPEAANDDGEHMLEDDMLARLSRAARIGPSQEDAVYLPQVLKAVDGLPPDQRRAVVLRRIIGHEEDVAAEMCGVDGRTVRNRLKRANERLKKYKEEL